VTLLLPARVHGQHDDTARTVETIIREHMPLVGHIVREVLGRVPAHVNRDDLMSAGMLALTLSAQSFDPTRGVPFTSFAGIRIRGALTDELRSMDWASRAVRGKAREVESARESLTGSLGRTPTRSEVAGSLGMTERDVDAVDQDVSRAGLLSVDALTPQRRGELPVTEDSPEAQLVQRETLAELRVAVDELPARLRMVVEQYFFAQRRMADIAAELGVTESRVSQLRSEALDLLRSGLRASTGDGTANSSDAEQRRSRAREAYCAALVARLNSGDLTPASPATA
jgi:RNA polymerase sigma factor for flagellar operon FliA